MSGSTSNRRTLSGGGEYAIESLPAAGFAKCDTKNSDSMIEKADGVLGTFRVRSTGFVGDEEVSLVASYKRASLLDFIYMTNYETSDPLTYGTSAEVTEANNKCKKYRREGRLSPCNTIVFRTGDEVRGRSTPMTNSRYAARRNSAAGLPTRSRSAPKTRDGSTRNAKDSGRANPNSSGL